MQTYTITAVTAASNYPLPGASLSVFATGTTTFASLYDAAGNPIPNPMTADANGIAVFQVADGTYDITAQSGSYVGPTRVKAQIFDLANMTVQIANFQGAISSGTVYSTTLAGLGLGFPAGTGGIVTSDPTPANDGTYIKSGASGSGSWTQVSTVTLSGLGATIAAETTRATTAEALKAPLASPALTGSPTTPNQTALDNSTKIANTGYVDSAVGVETSRAGAAEAANATAIVEESTSRADVDGGHQRAVQEPIWGTRQTYFYDGTNYLSPPTDRDVVYLFPAWGQSNCTSGATDVATTSPFVIGQALMPDTGVWQVTGQRSTQLVDAYETLMPGYHGETMMTSFMTHLAAWITGVSGATPPKIAGFVSGLGGTLYGQIMPGSIWYHVLLCAIEDCVEIAKKSGCRVVVPGVFVVKGEAEAQITVGSANAITSQETFVGYLRNFWRRFGDDVMRLTGQPTRPVLFVAQTNTVDAANPDQFVQLAQLAAGATEWCRLVGPVYNFPRVDNASNSIHMNASGQQRMGQMFARAAFAELYGQGWTPLKPNQVYVKASTTILIVCDVPRESLPLVIDTSGTEVTTSGFQGVYGFDVQLQSSGAYLTISSVSVSSNVITLTMASPLTAGTMIKVMYAMRRNSDGTTLDGPVYGARGLIRDSWSQANLLQSYTQYDWMAQWSRNVPVVY